MNSEEYYHQKISIHRLGRRILGYLIPFSPYRFRPSVSVKARKVAFATGIPTEINRFYPYTGNSTFPSKTQSLQKFSGTPPSLGEKPLIPQPSKPPTDPLSQIIPNNARPNCITATAGTILVWTYSLNRSLSSYEKKGFTAPKPSFGITQT